MKIDIDADTLRKRRLMIATPMFGGMCHGLYTRSMINLATFCGKQNIHMLNYYLFNDSLISRARNLCVDYFLKSDCTHLLFIDSDIGFNYEDVIALLALQSDESPYDVIGGAYPRKRIAWKQIVKAVVKGLGKQDADKLARYGGDMVFGTVSGTTFTTDKPTEVTNLGTGFMMIRRATFNKLKVRSCNPDMPSVGDLKDIGVYFDTFIEPVEGRYLGEDHYFCYIVKEQGMKIWMAPWIGLQHVGNYIYETSFEDIARIQ